MRHLNVTDILLLSAFILNLGLGLLVYLKDSPHRRVNISFSIFTWALAAWIFGVSMFFLVNEPGWRLFWARMCFLGPSIIPGAFLHFSMIFPKEKNSVPPVMVFLICILSLVFAVLSFTKLMVHSANWGTLTINYGIAHKFFSLYLMAGMFGGIFFLIKSYKNSIGLERIQIKYCLLGIFIMTILGITFNLIVPMVSSSRLGHLGPVSTIIMVSFIAYAILKHRLMDINIVLKKGTTYVLLLILLFVPSFLFILFSQKVFFNKINYLFSAIIVALLFLITVLFYRIKGQTEKAVEHLFV